MIDLDRVSQVYSGQNGKCCCGCAGKHTYASKFVATDGPGYDVSDQVNDKVVRLIVGKIERLLDQGVKVEFPDMTEEFISVVDYDSSKNGRVYIAYFAGRSRGPVVKALPVMEGC